MTLDHFRRQGYVVVRDAFAGEDLARVTADIGGVIGRRARALGLEFADPVEHRNFTTVLTGLFRRDLDSYIATARQTQHLASVHRFGLSPPVMQIVAGLGLTVPALSTRPVIHYMADQLKIEGGYHKTPIHQDWRSVQGSLDGITIWLPLFDVGINDYPLEVIPGSHRRGLLPSVDDAFGHRVAAGEVDENEFEPLTLHRGDAVFFSGFLVHRTGSTGGADVRIALSYRYNNCAEASFIARNFPSPYTYRPDMRLLQADFPTAADVATVFGTEAP
ncbi:MAG TPA: phytanoyl-CoA dioxygenase family protein [Steroidobacteraceae bacterium]|nr:phytanoyl-CoA dioxygenase family protein [Steroidobacteraceae bacterium]